MDQPSPASSRVTEPTRAFGNEIPGTTPFLIHDPEKMWLVESGGMDLFLVSIEDGHAVGARQHVLRANSGTAVFGIDAPASFPMRLLAVPTPDSSIQEISSAGLQGALGKEKSAQLLEGWISCLSRAAVGDLLPKIFDYVQPGEVTVVNETKAVLSRNGVVWVQLLEGTARFLGEYDLSSDGGLFPLSEHAWLHAEKNCRITAVKTVAIFETNSHRAGLRVFHEMMTDRLFRNLQKNEERERDRLTRSGEADRNRLDLTLQLLASPLRREQEVPEDAEDDAWLLACLALGKKLDIQFKPHPDRRKGTELRDPVDGIARASGVRVRSVALKGRWWRQDNGPLLCRREIDHAPVALLPSSPTSYRLFDPVARTGKSVDAQVAGTLEPFAWQFYRPFPAKKLGLLDLVRLGLDDCRGGFNTILLMGVAAGLLGMALPVATGILFDSVIPGANHPQLLQLFVLMVVVCVCTSLFQVVQSFSMLRLQGKMDSSLQAAVWDRLLSLPVPFFRDYTAGDLAMRSLSISAIWGVLTGSVLSSVLSGVFSIFSFALLFYYSWRLALLATGLTITTGLVTILSGYQEVRYQRETTDIQGRLSGKLLQFINGISKLRVSATENRAFAGWAREFARQKRASIRARKVTVGLAVFTSAFPVLSSALIFYAMAALMGDPKRSPMSTGDFLAFNAAFSQFEFAVLALSSALISVLHIVPLYERARPILQALPEVDRTKGHPGELSGSIEVKHVSFRYRPDTPLVLRDVSLKVRSGQFVAIVGPSGSGKSTMFRMLLGFETPESGAIYYDNQDQCHLDMKAVRQQTGVVLQGGRLFSDSIYRNIVGSAPLTMEEAWEAACMAGLDKDIQAMPMGMHTVIAEGGGGLSGGQRQRLMIARAIVKKPRILLFDEATSALDNETQTIVSRSLESLQATRIVIAHRLSTIANADYIYVMDRGIVVQEGTYQDLIAKAGPFADLARRQIT
jgi:NHLM bacteriocin system ABC transporter ATP-binding protein